MRKILSNQFVVSLICLVAALVGSDRVAQASSTEPDQALLEVMINSEEGILFSLAEAFGADATTTLMFTTNMDLASNTFSFASVAGSTYLGMAFSYTVSGSMDSLGNTVETGSGSIGGQLITADGTGMLVGDPEYDIKGKVTINGIEYKRVGKTQITFNSPTTSKVTLENVGTGKQYAGTDTAEARPGGLKWTWGMLSDSLPDKTEIKIDASGDSDSTTGKGTLQATIKPLPEPGTVWTMLTGVVGGLAYLPAMLRARRRRLG